MNCLCYAAEMFGIFYSQWDYQMVNFSRILKFLTLNEFDVFGWNDPVHTFFFIRTSNFCLRLAVLIFFFSYLRLKCPSFPDWTLQCHKEECQTEYNKNTLFHSFILFLSCSALRQPLPMGGVLQKLLLQLEFNFLWKLQASSLQLY